MTTSQSFVLLVNEVYGVFCWLINLRLEVRVTGLTLKKVCDPLKGIKFVSLLIIVILLRVS